MQWLGPGEGWDQLKGGLDAEVEGAFLTAAARRASRPGMIGFDTGCFTGWTASRVWDVFKELHGHFYCVDWFKGNVDSQVGDFYWHTLAAADLAKEAYPADRVLLQLLKNIESKNALDTVSVIVAESWRPAELLADASVDYVYIGGDHRYSGVKRDLEAWLPKMRSGGVICGHALSGWVEPESEYWKQLCEEPEQDYYHGAKCHFGVNRALWDMFRDQTISICGNCWAKVI